MIASVGLLLVAVLVQQVPPPDAARKESASLREESAAILEREAAEVKALADRLASRGDRLGAEAVRGTLPPPTMTDEGASRFQTLPPIVGARSPGLANIGVAGKTASGWKSDREAIRATSAAKFFELATKAATARQYSLADSCLRKVIVRQPEHAEARRLLGFVPFEGGWATPYAVAQLKAGKTLHPTYGWVKASWVPHLEAGELPSRAGLSQGREVWVAADLADAERSDWASAWEIDTEHFLIRSNVPLSEAIDFGRHLETLNQLFESLLADVIGDASPLAQRFRSRTMVGERPDERHKVAYFASRDQFVENLRARRPDIGESLGIYLPADRGRRGQAYFFRDKAGQIDVTATLYHEVSHQLLFESGIAGPNVYKKNVGNFWVFEGLGTYFETFAIGDDGAVEIGGMVGPRLAAARRNLVMKERIVPLKTFVNYNEAGFMGGDVFLHYQQAIALTTFLMQARGGAYREGFLDYVKAACQGHLKGGVSGKPLDVRVGKPYADIEAELLTYLKDHEPSK